jgi:hypothetical protein
MFGTNTNLWKVVAVCEVVQPKGNLTMVILQSNPDPFEVTHSYLFYIYSA